MTTSALLFFAAAAYSDIRTLRISNSICIVVALLGLLRLLVLSFLSGDLATGLYTTLSSIGSAAIVLFIGLLLFARRLIGGGDVKLLAATVLLIEPHNLFPFFMMMSIFGALLAILMLALKHSPLPAYLGPRFAAFAVTTKMMVPYGVAIGVAGSITLLAQLYLNTIIRIF